MLITKRFVVLNFPKTGSTFVRKVIKKLHHADNIIGRNVLKPGLPFNGLRERIIPSEITAKEFRKNIREQHATFSQIPEADRRSKQIMSVFRNPLERYVSTYEYKWYAKNPFFRDNADCIKDFPGFPDLSFSEYLEMQFKYGVRQYAGEQKPEAAVGPASLQFIRFFFPNPGNIIANLTDQYIDGEDFRNDFPEIRFLHTENLNEELYQFLSEHGYPEDKIGFIRSAGEANKNRQNWAENDWKGYYTDGLLNKIKHYDRLLFKIFPEYNYQERGVRQ